ncbi:MAG: hypothetical protein ACJ8G7_02125 [Rhizobacter sp.]
MAMFAMQCLEPVVAWARRLAGALLVCAVLPASAATPAAEALRERHAALAGQLASNAFQRPILLQSTQGSGELKGEVYAIVEHPFATLDGALRNVERWCDVLILPFNVKQCRTLGSASAPTLELMIGRKHDQPVADAYKVDFAYQLAAAEPDYLKVMLNADAGPMGTREYRIVFEATPLDVRRSFIHMAYSYGFGLAARIAMQAYLATAGSGKVGFSIIDRKPDGQPVYVASMRGVIERNTMRYYLAIDAYLDSLQAAPAQRVEHRLHQWFSATERYPRQLHEIEEAEYLAMKRREIERQQALAQAKTG